MKTVQSKPKIIGIAIAVFLLHCVTLASLHFFQNAPLIKKTPTKVIVSTIQLSPTKQIIESKKEIKPSEISSPIASASLPIESPTQKVPDSISEAPAASFEPPSVKEEKPEKKQPKPAPKKDSPPIEAPAKKEEAKKIDPPKKNPNTDTIKPKTVEKPKPIEAAKAAIKKPAPQKEKNSKLAATPPVTQVKNSKPTSPSSSAVQNKNPKKEEKEWSKEEEALLKSIQDSMGSLNTSRLKSSSATAEAPKQIAQLGVESSSFSTASFAAMETSYKDELIRRLKIYLKLPEHGDVKLQLTINREGKILKLNIIHSESEKNREYVEKTLPSLTMPNFGDRFKDKTQHIFPVTLSNE